MTRRAMAPLWAVVACSAWMASAGNAPLWRQLNELGLLTGGRGLLFAASMLLLVTFALAALLALLAWRTTLKPAATLLLLATAVGSHFMWRYHVVIDAGMVTNALQTDLHEAGALLDATLVANVLLLGLLPAWLLWRLPMAYARAGRQFWLNLAASAGAMVLLMLTLVGNFQTLAPAMRNHKELRYLLNPLNSLYALGRNAWHPLQRSRTLQVVGEDARPTLRTAPSARPPLLVLVLGETARSGNFGLNGYARATTPELQAQDVASFRNAWSCGTSTAASVPCMYSNLGREHFEHRTSEVEGLLDVLYRAGYAVLWLDNQSGCKGVCDRVPTVNTCPSGDCPDTVMLDALDQRLDALDATRRARGTVIVMHQMGSHGPAYYLRSPEAFKRFLPECRTPALQECDRNSVVNAYDNSIAYTDHFLARTIAWLKRHETAAETAMVYVADHGESLGEGNLYLHGMPYAMAPDVQKRVPWITWLSATWEKANGLSTACLRNRRDALVSHDHYFHSVLGLMGVATRAYQPTLDVYAPCHTPRGAAHQAWAGA